jgi:hypothetical protein
MKIYLQSRGFEQDYNWVDEVQKIVDNPDIFNKFGNLLQATKRSLLFAQSQDKLLLSVTNIESPNRQDYQNRKIRVSIAWVSEYNPDNLDYFRYLAIRILKSFIGQDDFTQKISDGVESGGENGFTVKSFDVLEPPQDESSSLAIKQNSVLPQKLSKIEDDNFQTLIQDLITDLESCDLPKEDGPLVVVTGIQDKAVFDNARVWRGIAKFTGENLEKKSSINPIIPAIIVVLILAGILIMVITLNQPKQSSPTQTPSKELEDKQSQQQECQRESSIPCLENSKLEDQSSRIFPMVNRRI